MRHVRIHVYHSGGVAELVVDADEDGSPSLCVTDSGIMRFKRTESTAREDDVVTWLMDIPLINISKISR
jgi:hypothetical protein